jgi:hypothetical protein
MSTCPRPQLHRSRFRPDEDRLLYQLVQQFGLSDWRSIAVRLPGRSIRQCRDRWQHYLATSALYTPWTPDEDQLLQLIGSAPERTLALNVPWKGNDLEPLPMVELDEPSSMLNQSDLNNSQTVDGTEAGFWFRIDDDFPERFPF